jgi:N-acetylglucosamine-6-phosphate deacetylase
MKYFDLQVNGYGGVDFNRDAVTANELRDACKKLLRDGVEGVLATVITDELDVMRARIRRIAERWEADDLARQVIAGIHVEGPFISSVPGYVGAHPPDAAIAATVDAARALVEEGKGLVKLVTLAPECDAGFATTAFLAGRGIRVAAGHTNASIDELRGAIDAGLTLFTHLGNGCPMHMHRHDNIVQRVLSLREKLWICFIADGAHVPFFALRNYLDLTGLERAIVVTDAIAPAGMGPGRYSFSRWNLDIGEDMVARAPDGSHLVGSAITMKQSESNLRNHLKLTAEECNRLLRENPRRAIRI